MIRFVSVTPLRVLILATALMLPAILSAQTTWKGGVGEWSDAKNWSKGSVPSLKPLAAPEKPGKPPANKKPSNVKPSAPPPAASAAKPIAFMPPPLTSAIIIGTGTVSWNADTQGDFAVEVPVTLTKKAGWKQTSGISWIFVRNGGSITMTDATFDGGTSNNLIIGSDNGGTMTVSGDASALTMPAGEIKVRRNGSFILQAGKVTANLLAFDEAKPATKGLVTLAGGTMTLTQGTYGGIFGGDDAHYVNFAPGSKAVLILAQVETDKAEEAIEKGLIRFAERIDSKAFKVEANADGCKITLDPATAKVPAVKPAKP